MRFSIWPSANQSWDDILTTARHAEATGWDGVWIADHFMGNEGARPPGGVSFAPPTPETPTLEAGSLVAGLAAAVPRVRIGTLVFGNTYRHPAVLANMAATVDHLSGGRLTLGIGAGWQVNEHQQYGIELPEPRQRVDRFEEAIQIVRSLLRQPRTTFDGAHYRLRDALCEPKPVQARLPILVGTRGDRMLRITARYADKWNMWGLPDQVAERSAALSRACEAAGRDPAEIDRVAQALVRLTDDKAEADRPTDGVAMPTMAGPPERLAEVVAAYADIGLDELIVPDRPLGEGPAKLDTMDRFLGEVASAFR